MGSKVMNKIYRTRRDRLRTIAQTMGGQVHLANALGIGSSYVSQLIGVNPVWVISEKTARKFEEQLGLKNLTLDKE